MSDPVLVALIGGFFLALTTTMTVVLTPVAQDYVKSRREKIQTRTAYRESEAVDVVQSMQDALKAQQAEIESWQDIAAKRWEMIKFLQTQTESLQRQIERMDDGWYGQRPQR